MGPLLGVLELAAVAMPGDPLDVLEAGGGSATILQTFSRRLRFVTVDLSAEQLERNDYAAEKILGDLATVDLGGRRFDLVICFDVLEHLAEPASVADKLLAATRAGGVVVFKGPLPASAKGLVTRFTPHWVHVLAYRWLFQEPKAGRPGHAPFQTYLRPESDLGFLVALCARRGFELLSVAEFESDQIEKVRSGFPLGFFVLRGFSKLSMMLSRNRVGHLSSDYFLVARRGRVSAAPGTTAPGGR